MKWVPVLYVVLFAVECPVKTTWKISMLPSAFIHCWSFYTEFLWPILSPEHSARYNH